MAKAKQENTETLLSALKELDIDAMMESNDPLVIPTGFTQIDNDILGRGGLPRGKIVEFSGEPGTWKSSMLYRVFANAQKQFPDKKVVLFDTEFVVQEKGDLEWIRSHGVDISKERFIIVQHGVAEDAFNAMLELSERNDISVIGLDSLGNMEISNNSNSKRFEKDDKGKTKDDRVGAFAKVTGASFKLLAGNVARNKILFVSINQIRDNLSMYGGGGFNTPGGRAYKHNLSVRIEFYKVQTMKKGGKADGEIIGDEIKAIVRRSKVSVAGQTSPGNHLKLYNGGAAKGENYEFYDSLVDAGVIRVGNAGWLYCDKLDRKWRGLDKIQAELDADETLKEELKVLLENGTTA